MNIKRPRMNKEQEVNDMAEKDTSTVERFREIRTLTGMTYKELSEITGFSISALTKWKSGVNIPTQEQIEHIEKRIREVYVQKQTN